MAVRIRLSRKGRKNTPFYRIVVADREKPRDGRFLEVVGTYDPKLTEHQVSANKERVSYWLARGAEPSLTVQQLLKRADII